MFTVKVMDGHGGSVMRMYGGPKPAPEYCSGAHNKHDHDDGDEKWKS